MDPKLKKKIILARNKKHQRIFQHAREHKAEHERIIAEEQERLNPERPDEKTRRQREEEDEVWSEKVHKIRNRITKKKRKANERWNRFAATSDAGARGR